MLSANKLYKQSGSTLPFKDWLEREKAKGKFIPNVEAMEEFYNADGTEEAPAETTEIKKADVDKAQMTSKILRVGLIVLLGYVIYKNYKK
jgi:hypothetical protein